MVDDASLLRDYIEKRSSRAFGELVQRHTNLVYSAALRRLGGDQHRAQDVVQFVFNELARKPEPVARHPVLVAWLHTATRNAAFNVARSERRRQLYEQQAALTMNDGANQNMEAWVRLRPLLDEVVEGLPRADRYAVLMRYFEERPFAEIGRALRISEDAARMRVQRALEKLRDALGKRGFASTTATLGAVLAAHTTVAAPTGLASTVAGVALDGVCTAAQVGALGPVGSGLTGAKLSAIAGGVTVLIAAFAMVPFRKEEVQDADRIAGVAGIVHGAQPGSAASAANHATLPIVPLVDNVGDSGSTEPRFTPSENATRGRVIQNYYVLLSDLQLPAEKRESLITLLVDLREAGVDYAAASATHGVNITRDPNGFNWSVRALREQIHAQMQALIGPQGFSRYLAFEEELQIKSYALILERMLRNTSSPLTSEQVEELTRMIGRRTFDPKGETLIAEASRFLSGQQLDALRQVQDRKMNGTSKPKILEAVREQTSQPTRAATAP